jgi:hypothetical protein
MSKGIVATQMMCGVFGLISVFAQLLTVLLHDDFMGDLSITQNKSHSVSFFGLNSDHCICL